MTNQDKEAVQRALGIIEGANCISPKTVRDVIATAVEMIDEVMNKEEPT